MMQPTTARALGQARLADLHHQAQRAALARAARQARRAQQRQPGYRVTAIMAALTARARRPAPEPESS